MGQASLEKGAHPASHSCPNFKKKANTSSKHLDTSVFYGVKVYAQWGPF